MAVQGRINGELGSLADDGVLAALVNFGVGWVALVVLVGTRRETRAALGGIPAQLRKGALPWWTLLGGFGGATFVVAQSTTVSALGVALFTIATVAGQTGMSLAVDRWGLGPAGVVPLTVLRIIAAVLATVAVAVAASGRGGASGSGARWFVFLALIAGAAVAFQTAFNGRVSVATGKPTVAALVNFTIGLLVLFVVLAVERSRRATIHGSLPSVVDRPWLYAGGFLGILFVVTGAWSVRALGVLLFSLVVIAGTLLGAVAVDLVAPTPGVTFTWALVTGVVMTFCAVALASVRKRLPATWQDSAP